MLFSSVCRDLLSGGQVSDEISTESKFSRPSLLGSLELKPSKDISSASVSSRAYLLSFIKSYTVICYKKVKSPWIVLLLLEM